MIETISTIGGALTAAAIGIASAIVQTVKKKKGNKIVKLAKIVQKLPEFINEAEEALGSGTGVAKLQYVLNKCHIECLQANIKFDESGLTAEIEKILSTPTTKKENNEEGE